MAEEPSQPPSAVESLSFEALIIDENKSSPNLPGGPNDSNIETEVNSGYSPYTSAATFEELSLSPELLKGLYVEMGFIKPSKIQEITLPMILNPPHKDLIAQARNGSGKTTCFVLGMLSRVDPNMKAPQALCICPTRELAIQNNEVLQKMGKYTGISSELAIPSMDKIPPSRRPPIMAQVVIGTPGTINSLKNHKKLGVTRLKILVFDEADQMLAQVNLVILIRCCLTRLAICVLVQLYHVFFLSLLFSRFGFLNMMCPNLLNNCKTLSPQDGFKDDSLRIIKEEW
ncbi:putative RNA helicase [Medicago truncatula]|uniref:ATP-dependent RNA helicase n=1 Tax=Medicago truncatula TaxID=3880 RepID=A0A396I805_MEDTR|nr:putative RNA helicase [Medicago truncatula]